MYASWCLISRSVFAKDRTQRPCTSPWIRPATDGKREAVLEPANTELCGMWIFVSCSPQDSDWPRGISCTKREPRQDLGVSVDLPCWPYAPVSVRVQCRFLDVYYSYIHHHPPFFFFVFLLYPSSGTSVKSGKFQPINVTWPYPGIRPEAQSQFSYINVLYIYYSGDIRWHFNNTSCSRTDSQDRPSLYLVVSKCKADWFVLWCPWPTLAGERPGTSWDQDISRVSRCGPCSAFAVRLSRLLMACPPSLPLWTRRSVTLLTRGMSQKT